MRQLRDDFPITEPTRHIYTDTCGTKHLIDKPHPPRPTIDQPKPYSAPVFAGLRESKESRFWFFYGIIIGAYTGILLMHFFG